MNILHFFWELNKTVRFSPLEISLFFYLYNTLETEVEVSETDSNLMLYLSLTERQVRYVRENLSKKNIIVYDSGNGRGNATIYRLGTVFSSYEKGDKIKNKSNSNKYASLAPFSDTIEKPNNQNVDSLKKDDNKGDNAPLCIDYLNLNHYQKENNLSKDRLQKKKSVDHSPCPDKTARKIKSEVKTEPVFSQQGFEGKKKTRCSKVFLTEGEILSIKTFIERFNKELGQYYGYVVYERTNSFSRQNILKLISMYDRNTIQMVFEMIKSSDFLLNKSTPYAWRCSFDWIVVPDNFGKIFAGMYANFNDGASVNVGSCSATKNQQSTPQPQKPYDEFDIRTWSKEKRDAYLTEVYACWNMKYNAEEYEQNAGLKPSVPAQPPQSTQLQPHTADFSKITDPTVLKVLSEVGIKKQ